MTKTLTPRNNIEHPEFTFEELVDWAAGYLLQQLIAGKFRSGVWMICNQAILWSKAHDK